MRFVDRKALPRPANKVKPRRLLSWLDGVAAPGGVQYGLVDHDWLVNRMKVLLAPEGDFNT